MPSPGIDVASFQPLELIHEHLHRVAFGIVKLTQGAGYVNPIHDAQLHAFAHAGKPVGVYHFLEQYESAARQWRHFEQVLAPWRGRVIVAVDHEADVHGVTPTAKLARAFIRAGESRGFKVGRYGSSGQTMSYLLGERWRWVAEWGPNAPPVQWDVWQTTGSRGLDEDLHRLSGAALRHWWLDHCYRDRRRVVPRRGGSGRPSYSE